MIRAFLPDGKYAHYKLRDAYIEVLKVVEYEDHSTITVIWKCQRTDKIFARKEQTLCVHKTTFRDWDIWPK